MPALGQVYWRGYLRLQLVSISVNVYTATESKSEITFNQIHEHSGKRYQKVVPGIGEIDGADIVKGYQDCADHHARPRAPGRDRTAQRRPGHGYHPLCR